MQEAKRDQEIADEKAKFIQAESAKIDAESIIAKRLAAEADAEL